jgi:hypothetical protein
MQRVHGQDMYVLFVDLVEAFDTDGQRNDPVWGAQKIRNTGGPYKDYRVDV